jgi:hypothetical protein
VFYAFLAEILIPTRAQKHLRSLRRLAIWQFAALEVTGDGAGVG